MWIIVAALGVAALVLAFSLFKKLVKLAFTALALLLVLAGIWYYSQQDPEIADTIRQVGERAGETLERVTEEALEKASDVARDGAERALEKTGEMIEGGAKETLEKASPLVADTEDEVAEKESDGENPSANEQ